MSEHDDLIGALRDIAATLERIEAKLGQPEAPSLQVVLSLGQMAKAIRKRYAVARELAETGQIRGRCENGRWYFLAEDVEAFRRDYVDGAA